MQLSRTPFALALVLSIAVIQEYQAATTEHWMLDVAFLYWVGVSSLSLAILASLSALRPSS